MPGPSDPVEVARGKSSPPRVWYSGATAGQWLALLAALLGWMFDGFEQGVFPILARPALVQLLGLQDRARQIKSLPEKEQAAAKAGVDEPVRHWNAVMSAAYLFGAAAGGLVFGWLGDRVGRVRAMVFSVLTYAIFTGLCGLAQAPWHLGVLRFLAALGMGGEWSLGVALVMESWSAHARPVLAGLIGAAANVGFLLSGVVGARVDTDAYWRYVFIGCVLPALLTFLLRTFVPESERWEEAAASGPKARVADIFTARLRGRSLLGASLGAVPLLATWGAVTWIALWLDQAAGKGMGARGQMCAALGAVVGAFLSAVLLGRLRRRLGYLVLCALSLAVCEFLFVGLRGGPFDAWFFATVVLVGACSAAFYGWLPLYLPELFPTRIRATGQGFCYNAGRVLAGVGVLVVTFGINVGGNYPQASAIVCSVYVAGLALAWFIPETKGQPLPE
jgi:SHS family sialic acid transporter-like MFS transporter